MPSDPTPTKNESTGHSLPRTLEMESFSQLLPLNGVEASSDRVFNLWGERAVGKSTFLSELRESEMMSKFKALWIQPTRENELDTVEEFIRACSKTIRYPSSPEKEKRIAERIESVQKGKVNPVLSDDSLLITRSSIAANRKPYINKAAAASVGRTEIVREDVQVSVGLGESKANNQAEGFLDALPLQSMGTDLIILFIEKLDRLSITIKDWIRDYVIPAATRGAYRRNLVILLESLDPLKYAYPNENWGEWTQNSVDFRLYPLSEDDTYSLGIHSGFAPEAARYICRKSSGYPDTLAECLDEARSGKYDQPPFDKSRPPISGLEKKDLLKLAGLCLPNKLYPDELDGFFASKTGKASLDWLRGFPNSPLQRSTDRHYFQLPDSFRKATLSAAGNLPEFKEYRRKWAPLAHLSHNMPSKSDRAKLLMLSGLLWMDDGLCRQLFKEKADRVMDFVVNSPLYFNRDQERYRVSERLRDDLVKVANNMGHVGVGSIRTAATELWAEKASAIRGRIETLEGELATEQDAVSALVRKHTENEAHIRIQERKSASEEKQQTTASQTNERTKGPTVLILLTLSAVFVWATYLLEFPANLAALVGALASLSIGLAYIPSWRAQIKARDQAQQSRIAKSPAVMKKRGQEITYKIQDRESRIDNLRDEIEEARKLLDYPYVG